MNRLPLFYTIFLSTLALLVGSLALSAWMASRSLTIFYLDQVRQELKNETDLASMQLFGTPRKDWQNLCRDIGKAVSARVTIINEAGLVLGDSDEDPKMMDNHGDRPEVMDALKSGLGSSFRYSHTVRKDMLYLAKSYPIDSTQVLIRLSLPLRDLHSALGSVRLKLLWSGLGVFLFLLALSFYLSRRISKPLGQLRKKANKFAKGDLKYRASIDGSSEIRSLSRAMNVMAEKLQQRLDTIQKQQSELDAVFSSMGEGVIALDTQGRILTMNPSARGFLGDPGPDYLHKTLVEVARNSKLERMLNQLLKGNQGQEQEITIRKSGRERIYQIKGSSLNNQQGRTFGALLVLNDVTRLKKLETLRKDFVANVSHEIKTPIASIKAAAETLEGRVLNDREKAGKFVHMISQNAERLRRIVEDLLSLSRMDQNAEKRSFEVSSINWKELFDNVIDACRVSIEQKKIRMVTGQSLQGVVRANAPLLEQALINLVENAVKYSEQGSEVILYAEENKQEYLIGVRDEGCGIAEEHIPRLFERFYRIDAARSRELGGTGLGLAIVKHICQLHGGTVKVRSIPDVGSTFEIVLPRTD